MERRQASAASVPVGSRVADQLVEGAAVGAARLTRLLYRQIDAGMRVPELLRRQGAMQRKIGGRDLDALGSQLGRPRHFPFAPARANVGTFGVVPGRCR